MSRGEEKRLSGLRPARDARVVWRKYAPESWKQYSNKLLLNTFATTALASGVAAVALVLGTQYAIRSYRRSKQPSHWNRHLAATPEELGSGQPIPMSPCEQGMFKVSSTRQGAMKLSLCLRLSGPCPTKAAWQAAVRALEARHPLLGCVVARSVHGEQFFQRRAGSSLVRRVARSSAASWEAAWAESSARPAGLCEPLCEVVVVEGGEGDCFEVLLLLEHCICDAKSAMNLAHELLGLVSGQVLRLPQLPVPMSIESALRQDAYGSSVLALFRSLKALARLILLSPGTLPPPPEAVAQRCLLQYVSLDAEALREACRREHTTVTAALGAALMIGVAEELGSPVNAAFAVDIRSRYSEAVALRVDPAAALAFHVGFMLNPGRAVAGRGFWDVAREVRADMAQAGNPVHMAALMADELASPPKGSAEVAYSSVDLSNFGVSPLQTQYGRLALRDVVPATNNVNCPGLTSAAVTAGGRLVLSLMVPEGTPAAAGSAPALAAVGRYLSAQA